MKNNMVPVLKNLIGLMLVCFVFSRPVGASPYEGIYTGGIDEWQTPMYISGGSFWFLVYPDNQMIAIGNGIGIVEAFYDETIVVDSNGDYSKNPLGGRAGYSIAGSFDAATSRVGGTYTNPNYSSTGRIRGNKGVEYGTFYGSAGVYSGIYTGQCSGLDARGNIKAVILPKGHVRFYTEDQSFGENPDGFETTLAIDGSFSGTTQDGNIFTGNIDQASLTGSGTWNKVNCNGTWGLSRVRELPPTVGPSGEDIVVDFGAIGLWAYLNDSIWLKLSNNSPDHIVTGDIDGNGEDDVIADFGSTSGGIFVKRNLGNLTNIGPWVQLHRSASQSITTGDLDGNGSDDIVIDFGGIGLWAWMNDASWQKLHNTSPDQLVITDMDGNGQDDVVADYDSTLGGVFVKQNQGGWSKLHNNNPVIMATGDLDGNGSGDVIISFDNQLGLWARMNNASWLKLHNGSPDNIVTGDTDGNGQDDVVASFSSTVGGLWQKQNLGGWAKILNIAPDQDQMVMGDIDANGQSDLIGDFGSTFGGIYVRRNDGAWLQLHSFSPDVMATGYLDSN